MAAWEGDSDSASRSLLQSWPGEGGELQRPQGVAELPESALGTSGKTILQLTEGLHHLHNARTSQCPTGTLGVRKLPVGSS